MEYLTEHIAQGMSSKMFVLPIYDSKICFIKHNGESGYDHVISYLDTLGVGASEYDVEEYKNSYGFTFKDKSPKYGHVHFIVINGHKDYAADIVNVLAHENYHLVDHVCDHHGLVRYKKSDNEHIAYLTGYLLNELSKLNESL